MRGDELLLGFRLDVARLGRVRQILGDGEVLVGGDRDLDDAAKLVPVDDLAAAVGHDVE